MNYRAAFESSGKVLPVFPRSKKRTTFPTIEAAVKRLETIRAAGRGYVYGATDQLDKGAAYTIAL